MNREKGIVDRAGTAEIDALVQMRLGYLEEDHGPLDPGDAQTILESLPDYFRRHLDKDLTAYVIREDQEIVACAFLLVVEKPMSPAFINGKTGTVLSVFTRPEFRRKGYARRIMEALLADAKEMELSVVELKATEDGYALYRAVGFQDDQSGYRLMKWKNR